MCAQFLSSASFYPTGKLCVDPRPAVRKSAGQTLFSTIYAHGALLNHATWHSVLWQVRHLTLHFQRNLSYMWLVTCL